MIKDPIYNSIGINYNETRCADPYLASRMAAHLNINAGGKYVDIGCGTGNYLKVLSGIGGEWTGIDPSQLMLETARRQCDGIRILEGVAENIPFEVQYFDAAMANFTFHHWTNKQQGLKELFRVIINNGRVVMLSFTGYQMDGYWLKHYFPEMIYRSGLLVPEENEMKKMFFSAGFKSVRTENYFIRPDLQDHFLYSNKFRPEQYLNPQVRNGISSFSAFSTPEELESGLKQLEADIHNGSIKEIMRSYENDRGDYLFYIADK